MHVRHVNKTNFHLRLVSGFSSQEVCLFYLKSSFVILIPKKQLIFKKEEET